MRISDWSSDVCSSDLGSLRALRALRDLVADALAFLQAAEALGLDCREVHEDIRPAVLGCAKAEALGVVEPFHCAVLPVSPSLVWMRCPCAPSQSPARTRARLHRLPGGCHHPDHICVTRSGRTAAQASTCPMTCW